MLKIFKIGKICINYIRYIVSSISLFLIFDYFVILMLLHIYVILDFHYLDRFCFFHIFYKKKEFVTFFPVGG